MASSGSAEKPGFLRKLNPLTWWSYLELDSRSFLIMMKGALPPTIVISINQSNAISDITVTIGYLSALISVLSQALLPRGKFMKIMLFDLLSTCVAASLCCLAVFCAVKARQHNTPADANEAVKNGYNSDACAVSAIWLIFMIWIANSLRAWKPMELQDPMVAFSIFSSVTITRAGTFTTLTEGLSFITMLLKAFMIGFAIATGVSLLILPITSRGHVFNDIKSYVAQIDSILQSQISFVKASSTTDAWAGDRGLLNRTRTAQGVQGENSGTEADEESSLESKKKQLQSSLMKLNALQGKLQSDLVYSKNEFSWGKLSAGDLNNIGDLLRNVFLPLSGMAMLPDILDMIVKNEEMRNDACENDEGARETRNVSETQNIVETLIAHLADCNYLVNAGLQYVLLELELVKSKHLEKQRSSLNGTTARDEESKGDALDPLQKDFAVRFEQALHRYFSRHKNLPSAMTALEAFSSSAEKYNDRPSSDVDPRILASDSDVKQEFFLIVYMGHLQEDLLNATFELIKFADTKASDGTMKRNRLVFPEGSLRDWLFLSPIKKTSNSGPSRRQSSRTGASSIYQRYDAGDFPNPESLPPENIWERGSTILQFLSRIIRSEQSVFGFRVAAASFCVGILAYLHKTQEFFTHQRCIWAMIVIVIGMSPTTGQTLFGFIARIAATVVSLALSLIVWYIVDGKTAGVIVFLYLANVFEYYFYVKVPQYFGASVIAIVTMNVIVGYELQVRQLGIDLATSNGQPYYPIYLFGPYKLATVAAGCAISFFWVIFPYPITAKSQLRKMLGSGLFALAQFYSCMHTTIELWLNGELGTIQDVKLSSNRLASRRRKLFREEMTLLNALRMHSHFSTFEPAIGGKFPKSIYDAIISETQQIVTSMALMAQTTQNLNSRSQNISQEAENAHKKWASRLAGIALDSEDFKSHSTTSLLCHLSSALTNAQPLPPLLSTGHSFPLARQMQWVDNELLSIRHIEDPAFSTFVSLEVLRTVVNFSLKNLLGNVRSLVGELSFDVHLWQMDDGDGVESSRLMSRVNQDED